MYFYEENVDASFTKAYLLSQTFANTYIRPDCPIRKLRDEDGLGDSDKSDGLYLNAEYAIVELYGRSFVPIHAIFANILVG